MKYFLSLALILCISLNSNSQELPDTTQGEYPYVLPILGKQAHEKGYKLQLPFGIGVNGIYNQQGIVLSDFLLDFTKIGGTPDFERLKPLADLIQFGPSDGSIYTFNVRADAWILPFLAVSGYYGRVYGEQTVTLTSPIALSSTTDIIGQYYGMNILAVAPLGPVNLAADYSWSWTTNDRLDAPVRVEVSGIRVIKRFMNKNRDDRFFAVWGGAQFQKLENLTSGKIELGEALDLDGETINDFDNRWAEYQMTPEWDELGTINQELATRAYEAARETLVALGETVVHYEFQKDLEFNWNMLIGGQYQHTDHWQVRFEYGFLQSKQTAMLGINYRFGL